MSVRHNKPKTRKPFTMESIAVASHKLLVRQLYHLAEYHVKPISFLLS